MREILFRGKIGKDWVYGGYCKDSNGTYIMTNDLSISQHTKVKSVSVGQYTGFQDINVVKIFEGDVVTFPDGEALTVKWQPVSGAWKLVGNDYKCLCLQRNMELCTVIGNIYDNPELLEGKK